MEGSRIRRGRGRRASLLAVLALVTLAISASPAQADRYSIANGCFTLTSASTGQAAPGNANQRLKATRLGSYLLYGTALDFLAATGGDAVGRMPQPGPATDWAVEDAAGGSFTLSPASRPDRLLSLSGNVLSLVPRNGAGAGARFAFTPANACASFPEAELNASGTPSKGATPYGEVSGLFDGHMHWMSYSYFGGNFHCGKPWSPYGITAALPDCAAVEGPAGALAPMQNFLNFGSPVAPHDTAGWPQFTEWAPSNLTYEGNYYRWVQRVWMAGLRLIAMPVNENRLLCELQANRIYNCDEMDSARRELDAIYALQDYVDAQAGGPGKGFFRIVTDPLQARRVINEGKLAVVLEMEISEPYGCRGYESATCTKADIDKGLGELYSRGVRSSLLLNKYDNPLVGVRFDGGNIGTLLNAGNKVSSGSFWSAKTCTGPEADNSIDAGIPASFITDSMLQLGVPPGTVPAYPPPPHCNTRGLTDLGRHTVKQMMDLGMIVNPDHMSQLGVSETISLAEARHYSGVISPHGWMDPRNWPRIFNLGGMAFPDSSNTNQFVADWRKYRPASTPYYSGWAYGADLGGLAHQPEELPPGAAGRLSYPFKSLDGSVSLDRQRSGARTFDYAQEGVAHYGLYADWIAEVANVGGPALARDMLRGPEAYLQMWERAEGIASGRCLSKPRRFSRKGLGNLRLGTGPDELLRRAGQPLQRTRAWTYCVKGARAGRGATAVLTPEGTVALVASTVSGHRARGIGAGTLAKRLKGRARPVGKGVWVHRLGRKVRIVYLVRRGKVRVTAVAGRDAGKRKSLREYLDLVPTTGIKKRPKKSRGGKQSPWKGTTAVPVTPANAVPLKLQQRATDISAVCGLAAKEATRSASAFAPPAQSVAP